MSAPSDPPASPGRRVLIVEDEVMIRMLLEDMLADLGHTVTAMAGGIDEALRAARDTDCDVAILDINLSGTEVYAVAEVLRERGIPFVFATGYGERGLPAKYRGQPTLQKPFQREDLEVTLARVFSAGTR
jgi:CheY-like chemotaxis protein